MVTENRKKGDLGERIAAEFLEGKGYRIIERQWRCKIGEIDLVAEGNGAVVIVEVKMLKDARFGLPEHAIRPEKARRLARLLEYYQAVKQLGERPLRVDVVAIELDQSGAAATVRHHENVLADLPFLDSRRRAW